MSSEYFDEEERELMKNINNGEEYSKKTLYGSVGGLFASAIYYYFTGEPSLDTLNIPLSQMNNLQLTGTTLFGISSMGYIGSIILYSLTSFMNGDNRLHLKNKLKEKKKNLEKTLKDQFF